MVDVTGFQWQWQFDYPDDGVTASPAAAPRSRRSCCRRRDGALRRHVASTSSTRSGSRASASSATPSRASTRRSTSTSTIATGDYPNRRVRRVLRPRPPGDALLRARSCRPTEFEAWSGGMSVVEERCRSTLRVDDVLAEHDDGASHGARPAAHADRLAHHHRPQGDRRRLRRHRVRVPGIGGSARRHDPRRARRARDADRRRADVQQRVHDPRQRDGVPVRRARSGSPSPTTSCRCRSARRTWRSRASTPCRTGCTCSVA